MAQKSLNPAEAALALVGGVVFLCIIAISYLGSAIIILLLIWAMLEKWAFSPLEFSDYKYSDEEANELMGNVQKSVLESTNLIFGNLKISLTSNDQNIISYVKNVQ